MRIRIRSLLAVVFLSAGSLAMAQDSHAHATNTDQQDNLLQIVRQANARFQNVALAQAEGYVLQFGCVTGDDFGAMGLHYVNANYVNSGLIDPTRPQIVIYEPQPDGTKKLIGIDFLLIADQWNATHSSPPELMGQLFHYFPAPNRFGLPAFYTLHVWAWKDNPKGAFVNWHPKVSCESYTGK